MEKSGENISPAEREVILSLGLVVGQLATATARLHKTIQSEHAKEVFNPAQIDAYDRKITEIAQLVSDLQQPILDEPVPIPHPQDTITVQVIKQTTPDEATTLLSSDDSTEIAENSRQKNDTPSLEVESGQTNLNLKGIKIVDENVVLINDNRVELKPAEMALFRIFHDNPNVRLKQSQFLELGFPERVTRGATAVYFKHAINSLLGKVNSVNNATLIKKTGVRGGVKYELVAEISDIEVSEALQSDCENVANPTIIESEEIRNLNLGRKRPVKSTEKISDFFATTDLLSATNTELYELILPGIKNAKKMKFLGNLAKYTLSRYSTQEKNELTANHLDRNATFILRCWEAVVEKGVANDYDDILEDVMLLTDKLLQRGNLYINAKAIQCFNQRVLGSTDFGEYRDQVELAFLRNIMSFDFSSPRDVSVIKHCIQIIDPKELAPVGADRDSLQAPAA